MPFLFLGESNCHYLGDFEGFGDESLKVIDVNIGEKGVIVVKCGVGLKERVTVGDCEGQ